MLRITEEIHILYTILMPTPHTVLEIRTGKDNEKTAAAFATFLASLPTLKQSLVHKMLSTDEQLSFEIIVRNQTISFQVFLPVHMMQYISASLAGSYPGVSIDPLPFDPLAHIHEYVESSGAQYTTGTLSYSSTASGSLQTFAAYGETDSMSALLSTLSKAGPHDAFVVQCIVANGETLLPESQLLRSISTKTSTSEQSVDNTAASGNTRPPLSMIFKVAAISADASESRLWFDAITSALQTSNTTSASLHTHRTLLAKQQFLIGMLGRSTFRGKKASLSLDEIATLYHLPGKKLENIANISWGKTVLGEPPEDLPIVNKHSSADDKQDINPFARTNYKNKPTIYGLHRDDRRRHLYVIGKTGTGKSTLLANMAINDLKRGEGLCVIDPHGDLIDILLDYIPRSRINDVIYFDPADTERTVQLNLFEGESIAHRELIASGIVSIFKKLYAYSWGPRLEYILRNALLTLLKTESARLSDILALLTNHKFREKVTETLDDDILKRFWLDEYNKMTERQRNESIASILNKVGQFVSSPIVRDVVNAKKSSFSIEEAMNEGKIVLANLSQGRLGEDNATLLGSMLITKIQLAAMSRVDIPEAQRKDFFLYVDEFQNFATESFTKILSEARKYRLNITLANQYIAQIPDEVQKAIFGNCGSVISFVMGADDATVFGHEYGGRYTPADLVSLGKYQIINKISINNIISEPFPANTLPLAASRNKNRPKVIRSSRERYAKKKKK